MPLPRRMVVEELTRLEAVAAQEEAREILVETADLSLAPEVSDLDPADLVVVAAVLATPVAVHRAPRLTHNNDQANLDQLQAMLTFLPPTTPKCLPLVPAVTGTSTRSLGTTIEMEIEMICK